MRQITGRWGNLHNKEIIYILLHILLGWSKGRGGWDEQDM